MQTPLQAAREGTRRGPLRVAAGRLDGHPGRQKPMAMKNYVVKQERGALQLRWCAWITLGSVILMACQFGVREVALVLAFGVLVTGPLLWLARRYIPS